MSDDIEQYEDDELVISRSEIKRQMHALQTLAARLAELKPAQWEQFNFTESMMEALRETLRIKSHNALQRHTKRLAKLLSKEDTEQVELLFSRMDDRALQDSKRFHRIEQWRDRLLTGDDKTLSDLLDICPKADRQHLRQLIRSGKKEQELAKPPAAQRKLFKYLRELDLE
ncbi:MAG: ribosome biogenesis factor YjgA [Sedimenticola sp.]|nr:ribosome biogenesis factor YjgA [Sedimenticola sp.]